MRTATVVFSLALVCAAQASWLSSAEDTVTNLKNTATANVAEALEKLQEILNTGTKQLAELTENVQTAGQKLLTNLEESVTSIADSAETEANALIAEAEAANADTDVSECKELANAIGNTAGELVEDAITCVTNKIDEAKNITSNIITLGTQTVTEVTGLSSKIEECTKNATTIKAKVAAATCLASVVTKTAWAVTTTVPAVAKNIASATTLVSTLQTSLTTCVSVNAIKTIVSESQTIVTDVKDCVAEKLEESS